VIYNCTQYKSEKLQGRRLGRQGQQEQH